MMPSMVQSSKPRTQRRFRFSAPLHMRQHFLHAHLDKALRAKLKIKTRAVQISKGDTVKVMVGKKRGASGKVIAVNLRTGRIFIDSVLRKNAKGKELPIPIAVSNVYITDLNLGDRVRAAKLKVAVVPVTAEKEQKQPATAATAAPAATAPKPAPVQAQQLVVQKPQPAAVQPQQTTNK